MAKFSKHSSHLRMSKTMVGQMPRGVTVSVPGIDRFGTAGNDVPVEPVGDDDQGCGTNRAFDQALENQRGRGVGALLRGYLGKLIISPSFLLSSLLVFLFVPDSVLKGTYTIDLRGRLSELLRRLFDIVTASIALTVLSPLFLIVPILIKLDSPGSIFYHQIRVGQNRRDTDRRSNSYRLKGDRRNGDRRRENSHGRLFVVYKFRSMRQDAEKKSGPVWAQQGDPRVTKVGRLLRATRVDEIPQFFNILRGDMSLVGPRPERPFFVNKFVKSISQYQ